MNKPLLKELANAGGEHKVHVMRPAQPLPNDSPYELFLGIKIDADGNPPVYRMSFREQHIGNPLIKTIHGGILASFAKIVAAKHLQASGIIADPPPCTSMTIDYLRPAFAGTLRAEPQTVRAGRRFVVVAVDILLERTLVSRGRFIYSRASVSD